MQIPPSVFGNILSNYVSLLLWIQFINFFWKIFTKEDRSVSNILFLDINHSGPSNQCFFYHSFI